MISRAHLAQYITNGHEKCHNKKPSCRRNAARCFVSRNISLRHSRSLKVIGNPFDRSHTSFYRFFIVTMTNDHILRNFRDKAKYWLKITISSSPPQYDALFMGELPSEYCHEVWCGKTRTMSLSDGEKCLRIRLLVLMQYANVADRRTEGQTRRHRPRLCPASHGNTRRWHVTISCQPDGRPPQPVRPWKS